MIVGTTSLLYCRVVDDKVESSPCVWKWKSDQGRTREETPSEGCDVIVILVYSNTGMVAMAPYNNKLIPADLIQEVVNMEVALKDGSMHAFEGPIYNQAGDLVVAEGDVADDGMLLGMSFYVQRIDGDIPQ